MYDPLHSLLSGSIRYLLSWVKEGKINNQSSSQPFLSPKCLLVLLVLNSSSNFNQVFQQHNRHFLYGVTIGGHWTFHHLLAGFSQLLFEEGKSGRREGGEEA